MHATGVTWTRAIASATQVKGKLTIIIAILEALSLITMRLVDWKESKDEKPAAGKARTAKGHRVVNPSTPEYTGGSPEGEKRAINILASGNAADEKIHEKE